MTPSHLPTPELLAEARRLADAATEGPWSAQVSDDRRWCLLTAGDVLLGRMVDDDTAEFIAASRTLLPELADRLAALTAAVERVEALVERVGAAAVTPSVLTFASAVRAALEGRAS